jgi:hypothetical protein
MRAGSQESYSTGYRSLTVTGLARCHVSTGCPHGAGPEANGITLEKNLPVEWSDTKNIRWKVPLPDRGNSTPIIWGTRIFITQAVETENRRTVMCLDRSNGRLLWQSGVTYKEKDDSHEANPHCSASPVTDGERVVACFGSRTCSLASTRRPANNYGLVTD